MLMHLINCVCLRNLSRPSQQNFHSLPFISPIYFDRPIANLIPARGKYNPTKSTLRVFQTIGMMHCYAVPANSLKACRLAASFAAINNWSPPWIRVDPHESVDPG
jgi:hypothetical protein